MRGEWLWLCSDFSVQRGAQRQSSGDEEAVEDLQRLLDEELGDVKGRWVTSQDGGFFTLGYI